MNNTHLKVGDKIWWFETTHNDGEPFEEANDDLNQLCLFDDFIDAIIPFMGSDGTVYQECGQVMTAEYMEVLPGDMPLFTSREAALEHLDKMVKNIREE